MVDEVAGRLVEALEAAGTQAEAGAFTLDEAAALRKLADHRLADPRDWLGLVVEAAVLLDARTITIDSKWGELVVSFDGAPPGLEGLFGSVFAASPEARASERARRKLAIGLHALASAEAIRQIEVMAEGTRMLLGPEPMRVEAPREPLAHHQTRLRVERRGRKWPELERLRERCRYASLDIVINGSSVAFGLHDALDSAQAGEHRWPIHDGEQASGWHGWHGGFPYPAELLLVCDGLLVERIALDGVGDLAIVEGPFRKDLSETKVLRDEYFDHVMAMVARARALHPPPIFEPVSDPAKATAVGNQRVLTGMMISAISAVLMSVFLVLETKPSRDVMALPDRDPALLSSVELSEGFLVTLPAVQACGRKHGASSGSRFEFKAWIEGAGTVRTIQLPSALADTALGGCVEAALRSASFRTFDSFAAAALQHRDVGRRRKDAGAVRMAGNTELAERFRMEADVLQLGLDLVPGTQLVLWTLEF